MEGGDEGMNIIKTWESFLFWVEGGEGVGCWEGTEESVILDGILKIHLSCMFTHVPLPTWLITKKRCTYPLDVHSYRHSNRHHRRSVVRSRYQSKCRHDGRASYTAWILRERKCVVKLLPHHHFHHSTKERKKKETKKEITARVLTRETYGPRPARAHPSVKVAVSIQQVAVGGGTLASKVHHCCHRCRPWWARYTEWSKQLRFSCGACGYLFS